MMDERERRVGLNEAVFREINERIEALADEFAVRADKLDLVCECGNAECAERIRMPRAEYAEVRSDATQFAVVTGHDDANAESVIARRKGYDVIRKREGAPARLAQETAPPSA